MTQDQEVVKRAETHWVELLFDRFMHQAEEDEVNLDVDDIAELVMLEASLTPDDEFSLTSEEVKAICKKCQDEFFCAEKKWMVD